MKLDGDIVERGQQGLQAQANGDDVAEFTFGGNTTYLKPTIKSKEIGEGGKGQEKQPDINADGDAVPTGKFVRFNGQDVPLAVGWPKEWKDAKQKKDNSDYFDCRTVWGNHIAGWYTPSDPSAPPDGIPLAGWHSSARSGLAKYGAEASYLQRGKGDGAQHVIVIGKIDNFWQLGDAVIRKVKVDEIFGTG